MSMSDPGLDEEEPSIFETRDPVWDAERDAEADEDIAAGRTVPHEEVAKWLDTWGTPEFKPMPKAWLR